jgi:hypothetical protein
MSYFLGEHYGAPVVCDTVEDMSSASFEVYSSFVRFWRLQLSQDIELTHAFRAASQKIIRAGNLNHISEMRKILLRKMQISPGSLSCCCSSDERESEKFETWQPVLMYASSQEPFEVPPVYYAAWVVKSGLFRCWEVVELPFELNSAELPDKPQFEERLLGRRTFRPRRVREKIGWNAAKILWNMRFSLAREINVVSKANYPVYLSCFPNFLPVPELEGPSNGVGKCFEIFKGCSVELHRERVIPLLVADSVSTCRMVTFAIGSAEISRFGRFIDTEVDEF